MTASHRPSTDAMLRRSVSGDGDERLVTLDPGFQGLPDTAHGGTVLAVFDAVAGLVGPRTVAGVYRRRVPLDLPLQLMLRRDGTTTTLRLTEGAMVLVDGSVEGMAEGATGSGESGGPTPGGGGSPKPLAPSAAPLPISRTCFACGTENPLGLRVRLATDDETVGCTWTPSEGLRGAEGALAGVAVTALLDETAFWLGAAASGESGMTTDLRVTLHRSMPFGRAVTVTGRRAAVRARPDDPRYWDTEVAAWDGEALVASASITFVAVRGAARKLVAGMLAVNPPDVLRRVFPSYAG